MRTLILSDIHGNFAALEAVAAVPHDAVICLGDIVGYGPEPAACVRWVRANARLAVQGNHDRAAADDAPPGCRADFLRLANAVAPLTRAQLADKDRAYLRVLPRRGEDALDGVHCAVVHATPGDPLYGYREPDARVWAQEIAGLDADVLFVGHTHLQFALTVGGTRVVNPGSVGQPKDGDPRAAYAVIDDGVISLGRVAYDVDRMIERLAESDVDRDAVADLAVLLRSGAVPPHLVSWSEP